MNYGSHVAPLRPFCTQPGIWVGKSVMRNDSGQIEPCSLSLLVPKMVLSLELPLQDWNFIKTSSSHNSCYVVFLLYLLKKNLKKKGFCRKNWQTWCSICICWRHLQHRTTSPSLWAASSVRKVMVVPHSIRFPCSSLELVVPGIAWLKSSSAITRSIPSFIICISKTLCSSKPFLKFFLFCEIKL